MQLVSQEKYLQYKCQSLAKYFSILYQNPKYEMYLQIKYQKLQLS